MMTLPTADLRIDATIQALRIASRLVPSVVEEATYNMQFAGDEPDAPLAVWWWTLVTRVGSEGAIELALTADDSMTVVRVLEALGLDDFANPTPGGHIMVQRGYEPASVNGMPLLLEFPIPAQRMTRAGRHILVARTDVKEEWVVAQQYQTDGAWDDHWSNGIYCSSFADALEAFAEEVRR